jgi:hypothetical protein
MTTCQAGSTVTPKVGSAVKRASVANGSRVPAAEPAVDPAVDPAVEPVVALAVAGVVGVVPGVAADVVGLTSAGAVTVVFPPAKTQPESALATRPAPSTPAIVVRVVNPRAVMLKSSRWLPHPTRGAAGRRRCRACPVHPARGMPSVA